MGEVVKIGSLGLKRTRKLVKIQRSDIKITKVGPSDIKICQICYQNYPSWCLSDIKRWFLWHQELIGSDIKIWSDPTSKVELEADHSLLPPSLSRQARPFSSYSACGEKNVILDFLLIVRSFGPWRSRTFPCASSHQSIRNKYKYDPNTNMVQIQIQTNTNTNMVQIQAQHKYKWKMEPWWSRTPPCLSSHRPVRYLQWRPAQEDDDDTVFWS